MLLLENPLPVIVMGLLTVVILLSGFFKTGRVSILWAIAAVMGITAVMLAVEHFAVTPKEQIEGTLQRIAADLVTNDSSRVIRHISRTAPALRSEAERILPQLEIKRATVKHNLACEFHAGDPPRATARFNAVLVVSDRRGGLQNQRSPVFFIVEFVYENDSWKVVSYERHDPLHGPRQAGRASRGVATTLFAQACHCGARATELVTQTTFGQDAIAVCCRFWSETREHSIWGGASI